VHHLTQELLLVTVQVSSQWAKRVSMVSPNELVGRANRCRSTIYSNQITDQCLGNIVLMILPRC
jgi:hypothetical protein